MKSNQEFFKEINSELFNELKDTKIREELLQLKKEVSLGRNISTEKDINIHKKRIENILIDLNKNIDKITNLYNAIYTKEFNLSCFDVNVYNQLSFKKFKDGYELDYYNRLPKDAKLNFKNSAGISSAICYKIQEYLDDKNIYPKPSFKKAHIIFETVYDKDSRKYVWDNDHFSRFYISEIINSLVFVGIINSDNGLETSFEIKSSIKKFSDSLKAKCSKNNSKNNCIAYTRIRIIPM